MSCVTSFLLGVFVSLTIITLIIILYKPLLCGPERICANCPDCPKLDIPACPECPKPDIPLVQYVQFVKLVPYHIYTNNDEIWSKAC